MTIHIRRRNFITLLGGAVACPLAARAQQPAMPVIGFLSSGSSSTTSSDRWAMAVRKGLSEVGYVEGRNVTIEYRYAEMQLNRLPELVAELVQRRVDVIVTPGNTPAAVAAKAATTTIPIVFSVGGDPVRLGLVASLSRPGGNATGFAELNAEVAPKRLAILRDIMPRATRFALLLEPGSPTTSPSDIEGLRTAASSIGSELEVIYCPVTVPDIDKAFAMFVQERVDAAMVNPSNLFFGVRVQLAELAARHAIPVIYWDRELVEAGGLMSYGSNIEDQFRQVGVYAGRILKGEKPADLPVQQPTKFELVINLKTAKALGLEIPPTVLARADEVIE
jgi:putative ABC transport system substrate-binding protein